MKIFRMTSLFLAAMSAVISPGLAFAQTAEIPDLDLKLGVRRVEAGRVDRSVYILRLTCADGECSLGTLSLNECSESPLTGKRSFYPSHELKATNWRDLKVTRVGDTLVVEERGSDLGGHYVNTLRFGLEKRPWGAYAVTSFSGGFVKNSVLLKRVITAEFVPFEEHSELRLDCPLRVPGLEPSLANEPD